MKKILMRFLVLCLGISLCACGTVQKEPEEGKLKITVTVFPVYDWLCNILGDREAEVKLLVQNGTDPHSYQPGAPDIMAIAESNLVIMTGGESDTWVRDAVKTSGKKDAEVIALLDHLGERALAEEDEPEEYDEHVWLSLKNAEILCGVIRDALAEADPQGKAVYDANCAAYSEKLAALDERYRETIEAAPVKTLVFADRFPFRYLTEDYGLTYYAAFSGCSAESEASFETVTFLAKQIDELNLHTVMVIDGSDGRLARTVIDNTSGKDMDVRMLDSMQSVTQSQIREGLTYLSVMEKDLDVLKEALE